MNYIAIKPCDIANGTGVRVSLFISGCTRHCPGCFNSSTWDFAAGQPFTSKTEERILGLLGRKWISGLSLLGGDPFEPSNRTAIIPFLERVKREFPQKDIWCWTGFRLEELSDPESRRMLDSIDVLVDGPFVEAEKDISLRWRGSANQRVLRLADVREAERMSQPQ